MFFFNESEYDDQDQPANGIFGALRFPDPTWEDLMNSMTAGERRAYYREMYAGSGTIPATGSASTEQVVEL